MLSRLLRSCKQIPSKEWQSQRSNVEAYIINETIVRILNILDCHWGRRRAQVSLLRDDPFTFFPPGTCIFCPVSCLSRPRATIANDDKIAATASSRRSQLLWLAWCSIEVELLDGPVSNSSSVDIQRNRRQKETSFNECHVSRHLDIAGVQGPRRDGEGDRKGEDTSENL